MKVMTPSFQCVLMLTPPLLVSQEAGIPFGAILEITNYLKHSSTHFPPIGQYSDCPASHAQVYQHTAENSYVLTTAMPLAHSVSHFNMIEQHQVTSGDHLAMCNSPRLNNGSHPTGTLSGTPVTTLYSALVPSLSNKGTASLLNQQVQQQQSGESKSVGQSKLSLSSTVCVDVPTTSFAPSSSAPSEMSKDKMHASNYWEV